MLSTLRRLVAPESFSDKAGAIGEGLKDGLFEVGQHPPVRVVAPIAITKPWPGLNLL
jgi:hypothetical protein